MKVYLGQSDLTINLETGKDLTEAEAKIRYIKPNGVRGFWPATISNAKKGVIQYVVEDTNTIDVVGYWTIWSETILTGLVSIGEPVKMQVFRPGK